MSTNSPFKLSASDETNRLAEIYRAAASLICEKGYDATSMNDIAEAVGLTKAGIYHHIEGKKDLLFRIMNFGMDELDENVIIPARAIADAESRLRAIIANHVRLITSHITPQGYNPVTIIVEEVAGLTPEHRRKIDQRKRAYVRSDSRHAQSTQEGREVERGGRDGGDLQRARRDPVALALVPPRRPFDA